MIGSISRLHCRRTVFISARTIYPRRSHGASWGRKPSLGFLHTIWSKQRWLRKCLSTTSLSVPSLQHRRSAHLMLRSVYGNYILSARYWARYHSSLLGELLLTIAEKWSPQAPTRWP